MPMRTRVRWPAWMGARTKTVPKTRVCLARPVLADEDTLREADPAGEPCPPDVDAAAEEVSPAGN